MWSIEVSGDAAASRETIWAWYEAADQAPSWDPLIKRIAPDGPISLGVTGRNYPTSGPSTPFVYTEVTPLVSYTEVSKLPGAKAAFTHRLTDRPDGRTRIDHGAEISGLLSGLYRLFLTRNLRRGMRTALDNLVRKVEDGPPPTASSPDTASR